MVIDLNYSVDICKGVMPQHVTQPLYYDDQNAHRINVSLYRGQQEIDLTGLSCNGYVTFVKDGTSIGPLVGEVSGNTCSVVLPHEAYYYPGAIRIEVKLVEGEEVTTVVMLTGQVSAGRGDHVIDIDGAIVPSLDGLKDLIDDMEDLLDDITEMGVDKIKETVETVPTIFPYEAKMALLTCISKLAWVDDNGQSYYDTLHDALFPEVYVTGISCVYTQTGDVMDTDSVDSLRTDLVVTAQYSNGATLPVVNYTLAGNLIAGQCSILVYYGAFTSSFTVQVIGVPSGYTKYDYVENTMIDSSGGHPDWMAIDIGLNSSYCDARYIHELTFWNTDEPVSKTNVGCLFGSRPASGDAGSAGGVNMWMAKTITNKYSVGYNGVVSGYNIAENWGVKHTLRLEGGNVLFDNVIVKTQSAARETFDTSTIWLFGCGSPVSGAVSYTPYTTRIYSYRVTDSITGDVISDCVACTNPDSKAGIYDKVRRQFYYATAYSNFHCANEV